MKYPHNGESRNHKNRMKKISIYQYGVKWNKKQIMEQSL